MPKIRIHIFSFILLAMLWLMCDKYCCRSKGISLVFKESLPYNTKVQFDHNYSHYYALNPTSTNGYQLETQLIFLNNDTIWKPTEIYNKETLQIDTTIYVWYIDCFGYNKSDLVVKVGDIDNNTFYIEPIEINGHYYSSIMDSQMIDESKFRWIDPGGGLEALVAKIWLILLVLIPVYPIYIFYLQCKKEDMQKCRNTDKV